MKLLILLVVLLVIPSCSGLPSLLGGGTNVAANVPIGKEVEQSVVKVQAPNDTSTKTAERDVIETKQLEQITAEKVEIVNESDSWLLWLVALIGWILPSPNEISRNIGNFILRLFGRETDARKG